MSRVNQLSITAHIFDNTGSVYLRTEDMIIPLPALFIPCKSPRDDMNINSKIVYGHDAGHIEEIYVEETIDELDDLVASGQGGETLTFGNEVTLWGSTTVTFED